MPLVMDFSKLNLDDNQSLARLIIEEAAMQKFKNRSEFECFRNKIIKKNKGRIFHNLYFIKAYGDLLKEGKIRSNRELLSLIRKRSVRTMSGVAPVTVLTKPFPCPGRCIYCPNDSRMPKSYLPSQPAAQRAFRQRFNPYTQVFVRLKALNITGHEVSKVELRVIGGSFNAYPKRYQTWFLKQCLIAMNEFHKQLENPRVNQMTNITREEIVKSEYGEDHVNTVILKPLNSAKNWLKVEKENETASVRCIGINIETRPDFVTEKEVKRMRKIGITKVEIGVQTTSDRIQKLTKRGHGRCAVYSATRLLKDAGFKVSYHMMPNLPGSNAEFDKKMIGELFANSDYKPDYLKIYPCVVISGTEVAQIYKKGLYKPYSEKNLEKVLLAEMRSVPEWCRIDRIARDIPSNEVVAGFRASNIRQILERRLRDAGTPCRDIRSREIQNENVDSAKVEMIVREYQASGGRELFISYEDLIKDKIIALVRLRFPGRTFISELESAALIREIHVYGKQLAVGDKEVSQKQHTGWGKKLMIAAEKLAKQAGYKKIAVIAGIGTREYYRKIGYCLEGSYMIKDLV